MNLRKILVLLCLMIPGRQLQSMDSLLNSRGRIQLKRDLFIGGSSLGVGLGLYCMLNKSLSLASLGNWAKQNPKLVISGTLLGLGWLAVRACIAHNFIEPKLGIHVMAPVRSNQSNSVIRESVSVDSQPSILLAPSAGPTSNACIIDISLLKDMVPELKNLENKLENLVVSYKEQNYTNYFQVFYALNKSYGSLWQARDEMFKGELQACIDGFKALAQDFNKLEAMLGILDTAGNHNKILALQESLKGCKKNANTLAGYWHNIVSNRTSLIVELQTKQREIKAAEAGRIISFTGQYNELMAGNSYSSQSTSINWPKNGLALPNNNEQEAIQAKRVLQREQKKAALLQEWAKQDKDFAQKLENCHDPEMRKIVLGSNESIERQRAAMLKMLD